MFTNPMTVAENLMPTVIGESSLGTARWRERIQEGGLPRRQEGTMPQRPDVRAMPFAGRSGRVVGRWPVRVSDGGNFSEALALDASIVPGVPDPQITKPSSMTRMRRFLRTADLCNDAQHNAGTMGRPF